MASQLSNERTLVMFDAVGAGLIECIRLTQSDIQESQQTLRHSINCNCSHRAHNRPQRLNRLATVNNNNNINYHNYQDPYRSQITGPPDYDLDSDMMVDSLTTTTTTTTAAAAPATTSIVSAISKKKNHQMIINRHHSATPPSMYDPSISDHSSLMRFNVNNNNCCGQDNERQRAARQHYYHGDTEQINSYYGGADYDDQTVAPAKSATTSINNCNNNNQYLYQGTNSRDENDLKNSFSSSSTSTNSFGNGNNCHNNTTATTIYSSAKNHRRCSRKSSTVDQRQQYHHEKQMSQRCEDNYSLAPSSSCSSSSASVCDIEQQTKIAFKYAQQLEAQLIRLHDLRDTYLLHLKMGQNVRTISRAYALSSASLSSNSLGKLTSSRTHLASALSNGTINSKIAKASIKEFMETIDKIELELESLMGTFMLQIKSIQGFARICTGDVFEITIKYGDNQKFKTKIRVLKGDKQKCDLKEAIFRARINDVLSVKASECKGLGKKVLLGNKLCETKDLFTAHSQLMTISLNQTGSIKLNLVVTWNPLDLSSKTICDANQHHMLNFLGDINK